MPTGEESHLRCYTDPKDSGFCFATLLELHFGMSVLLWICCIFSEHLFLRIPLGGCFWIIILAVFKHERYNYVLAVLWPKSRKRNFKSKSKLLFFLPSFKDLRMKNFWKNLILNWEENNIKDCQLTLQFFF